MWQQTHLTIGELARVYALPCWKIHRLVDSLDVEIPRAGLYRLVPRELIPTIATELQRRGWRAGPESAVVGDSQQGALP